MRHSAAETDDTAAATPNDDSVTESPDEMSTPLEGQDDSNHGEHEKNVAPLGREAEPTASSKYIDLNHQPWGPGSGAQSHYWSVSMAEYRSMSERQWAAFGTVFYIPSAGFSTAEKHIVQWD